MTIITKLIEIVALLTLALNGTPVEKQAALEQSNQKLAELQAILASLTIPAPEATPPITPPAAASTPATVAPPVLGSSVKQEILTIAECREDIERNPFCNLYVYVTEDGRMKPDILVTVTPDDGGHISANGASSNSQLTRFSGFPKPNAKGAVAGAFFQYRPEAKGLRTLTITVSGVTKTVQVDGRNE